VARALQRAITFNSVSQRLTVKIRAGGGAGGARLVIKNPQVCKNSEDGTSARVAE